MKRAAFASLACAVALASLLGLASSAGAQSPERVYRFDLPAQTLGSALRAFGEVSHQQIIFSEAAVKGKRSHEVVGNFTAAQALDRLLVGTGMTVTRTADGVFYVGSGAARSEFRHWEPRSGPLTACVSADQAPRRLRFLSLVRTTFS
jgi:iron complex outermembrane recepter protein